MNRLALLPALCLALLLAACGGSKSTTASSNTPASSSTPAASASSTPSTAGSTTTSSSTAQRPPEVPPGTKTVASTSSGAPGATTTSSTDARLPATFTIQGGALKPPSVSAPVSVPVALTIVSGDGRAHTVLLRTAPPHTLHVPAHGRASILVTGLPAGLYVIEVDGNTGGALVIGSQPGP